MTSLQIIEVTTQMHANDSANLKLLLTYMLVDPYGSSISNPFPDDLKSKVGHGFNHLGLGRMICPLRLVEKYDCYPQ
jgi:hypothetical protein